MALFAVAHASLFDNELVIELVEVDSIKEAILKHSALSGKRDSGGHTTKWIAAMPDDLEDIKEEFINGDMLIDVLRIS